MAALDLGIVPTLAASEAVELAVSAEALGFDGVWVADSQSVFRDAFAILAICAVRTDRMLLCTGVTNPVTRHPAVLAGSFATLDELAPGRVVLALGRGESAVRTAGLVPASLERLEKAVVALRALLAGETTTWNGEEIRMAWPVRPVPIYLAASGPRTLRLAGRIADGVLFQVGAAPDLVRWALAQIEAGAHEAGRSIEDLVVCMRVGCAVADDPARAREAVSAYASVAAKTIFDAVPEESLPAPLVEEVQALRRAYDYHEHAGEAARHGRFLTRGLLESVAIAGTPEEAAERLRELAGLGPDRIVITFAATDARTIARTLSERVLPVLR